MTLSDAHHSSVLHLVSEHVRKYLILYTVVSVALAIPVGYYSRGFTAANKELFSNLVIFFAVLTIYPSMVQLKTEGLVKSFRLWKPILVSLSYVFILSPVIAFLVAPNFSNTQLGIGFVTANIVPASSASLGYVLIAGGSIELATALAVISLVVAIPAIPLFLGLYSNQVSVSVPTLAVMMSVLYILVLPFIVGQLTRYPILKKKGVSFVNKSLRHYLSLATMLSMFGLIFVLVDKVASTIITNPEILAYVIGFQSAIMVGTIVLSIVVSKAMRLTYEDHQAVAFTSVSKNQSVAATIATFALSPMAAIAPAIIPMIQPVISIIYINLEKPVRKFLSPVGKNAPESGANRPRESANLVGSAAFKPDTSPKISNGLPCQN